MNGALTQTASVLDFCSDGSILWDIAVERHRPQNEIETLRIFVRKGGADVEPERVVLALGILPGDEGVDAMRWAVIAHVKLPMSWVGPRACALPVLSSAGGLRECSEPSSLECDLSGFTGEPWELTSGPYHTLVEKPVFGHSVHDADLLAERRTHVALSTLHRCVRAAARYTSMV